MTKRTGRCGEGERGTGITSLTLVMKRETTVINESKRIDGWNNGQPPARSDSQGQGEQVRERERGRSILAHKKEVEPQPRVPHIEKMKHKAANALGGENLSGRRQGIGLRK